MHQPPLYEEKRAEELYRLIREHPLGMLVAQLPEGLEANHIPFVLEAERRHEVAALERLAEPSLWDRLRVPIATAAILALAFLVSTQREAFDATLSMAMGVSTAVPMRRRGEGSWKFGATAAIDPSERAGRIKDLTNG